MLSFIIVLIGDLIPKLLKNDKNKFTKCVLSSMLHLGPREKTNIPLT